MEKSVLDYVLVPAGLVVMVSYHIWLLYRILKHPNNTIIGINAINRRFWVRAMMEDVSKNGVLAVQTLRNNIMASTLLASTAIMLCSLIAVLMSSDNWDKSALLVFGDKSELVFSIKFFLILVCFLVAFLFNMQSIRYYSHASFLINVPFKNMLLDHHNQILTTEYVAKTVNKGGYFCFESGWVVAVSADDHKKDEEVGASREEYQKVWSAITMVRSIGNCPVLCNLLDLSGSIKACRNAALKCDELKFEQYKLLVGARLSADATQQMQNCLDKIKVLEH
uniref:DUF599 domain-containing protein n=1 Tax=Quercus lobata TaxID=97700 RepID=A0A7N2MGW9_QUELO